MTAKNATYSPVNRVLYHKSASAASEIAIVSASSVGRETFGHKSLWLSPGNTAKHERYPNNAIRHEYFRSFVDLYLNYITQMMART